MKPDNSEANATRCLCPGCPTYNTCMGDNGDRLFCARGKTACGPTQNGCLCGECPVWAENGLSSWYFCLRGAAS